MRRCKYLFLGSFWGALLIIHGIAGCYEVPSERAETATLSATQSQAKAGSATAPQNQNTTGLENPIECCMCRDECPPVNCPCVERAIVEVVSVHIKKFRPRGIDNEPESPWVELDIVPGKYDLMQLKDDLFAKVGATNIPVGHYSMIRLVLVGEEIVFCDDPTAYPLYVAQEEKENIEDKKGIKLFETFYVCPGKHTRVTLKFPEDGLLTWIQDNSTVRLHAKIWVDDVENL